MPRCHVDANVLLRFLRNDDAKQSPQAGRLLSRAQQGKITLLVSALTIAEVFYALRASYKLPRAATAEVLAQLLRTGACEVEHEALLMAALERVISANVDLGDAMLAASAATSGDPVATFDGDFGRFTDIKLYAWT